MKFCYLDESGTGDEPFAVMAGVIVDATRMHKTKAQWQNLIKSVSKVAGRKVEELHTRDFYPGNSPYRDLDGPVRSRIIDLVFEWLANRRHRVVFSAVDRSTFDKSFKDESVYGDIKTLWRLMATHIVLCLQKRHQNKKRNKGHTLIVFDNEHMERVHYRSLIFDPPEWTDDYYRRSKKQVRLDQIIDVPYFGDSKQVGLIQLADFVSYFLRRYIEIKEGVIGPQYSDEEEKITRWFQMIKKRLVSPPIMYKKAGRCDCEDLFFRYAPSVVQKL